MSLPPPQTIAASVTAPAARQSALVRCLAALDFTTDAETQLRYAARQLNLVDYFLLAGLLLRNHAFWDVLLPTNLHGDVAVFENRLGGITLGLADRYRTVYCLPATPIDAVAVRQRIMRTGVGNVRLLDPSALDAVSPAAIVLSVICGDSDPAASDRLDAFLACLPRWLDRGAVLLMSDNNRASYRRLRAPTAPKGLWSVAQLEHRLRTYGVRHINRYFNQSQLSPGLWPPPEFLSVSEPDRILGAPRAKGWLLTHRLASRWRPSYLYVASRESHPGLLDELVKLSGAVERQGWGGSKYIVKKLVAGNSGVTVALVGPAGRRDRDIVVRIASHAGGEARCQANAKSLEMLGTSVFAGRVPVLLHAGLWNGRRYTVETRCQGYELLYGRPMTQRFINAACNKWLALQAESMTVVALSQQRYQVEVGSAIADAAAFADRADIARLRSLDRWLQQRLIGQQFAQGFCHGDFKLNNLLFTANGELAAVIDWDQARPNGILAFDYLLLLAYVLGHEQRSDLTAGFVRCLLPGRLSVAQARLLQLVSDRLLADGTTMQALIVAVWFKLLREQQGMIENINPLWRAANLSRVLDAIEAQVPQCP